MRQQRKQTKMFGAGSYMHLFVKVGKKKHSASNRSLKQS